MPIFLFILLRNNTDESLGALLGLLFIAFLFTFLHFLGKGFIFAAGQAVRVRNRISLTPQVIARFHGYLTGFSYYMEMDEAGRKKFMLRLAEFMGSKDFIGGDGFVITEKVKVLISASATQLLFGLEHYTLDYFNVIRVYPGIFYSRLMRVHLKGGTSMGGAIMFSWKDFEQGYKNETDKLNLGLHELAHALKIQVQRGETYSESLREALERWDQLTAPMLENVKKGGIPFLRKYAGTNSQEFWAVCIEHFFEAPADFQKHLPNAYKFLCLLLGQNPLMKKQAGVKQPAAETIEPNAVPGPLKQAPTPVPVLSPQEIKTLLPPSPAVTRPAFPNEVLTWAAVFLILPVSSGMYGLLQHAAMTNSALLMSIAAFTLVGIVIFRKRWRRKMMNLATYLFHSLVLCGMVGTLLMLIMNHLSPGELKGEAYKVTGFEQFLNKEDHKTTVLLFLEKDAYRDLPNIRTVSHSPDEGQWVVFRFRTGLFGIKVRESWTYMDEKAAKHIREAANGSH
jgi:MtfA peptidase